jgi:glucose-6-phosphate 1-dehydrogenase
MTETAVVSNPLREGLRIRRTPQPCAMVIFGASGDLTERKLVPALYYLARERLLPPGFSVIGAAKTPYTDDQFRDKMRAAIQKYLKLPEASDPFLDSFCKGIFYLSGNFGEADAYSQLRALLDRLDRERGTSGNRFFYLSTPPSFFPVVIQHLGVAGLAKPKDPSANWTRLVIEKPFGRDLKSARELNRAVKSVFEKSRSTALIIIWARRRCRIWWYFVSPTASTSPSGTTATLIMCRSRWRRTWALKIAGPITKRLG